MFVNLLLEMTAESQTANKALINDLAIAYLIPPRCPTVLNLFALRHYDGCCRSRALRPIQRWLGTYGPCTEICDELHGHRMSGEAVCHRLLRCQI